MHDDRNSEYIYMSNEPGGRMLVIIHDLAL